MLTSVSPPGILFHAEGMATQECSHTQRPLAHALVASFPYVLSGWNVVAGPSIVIDVDMESLQVSIIGRADHSSRSPECVVGEISLGLALAPAASSRAAAHSPGTSAARGRTESDIAEMLRSPMIDLASMAVEELGLLDGKVLADLALAALGAEGVFTIQTLRVCISPDFAARSTEIDEFAAQYKLEGAIAVVHWLGDLASRLSLQDALAPPKVISHGK